MSARSGTRAACLANMFHGEQPDRWSWDSQSIQNGVGYLDGPVTFSNGRKGTAQLTLRQVGGDWKNCQLSPDPDLAISFPEAPALAITTTYSPLGFDALTDCRSDESAPRSTDSYTLVSSWAMAACLSPKTSSASLRKSSSRNGLS